MPTGTHPLPGPLSISVGQILAHAVRSQGRLQADIANAAGVSAAQLSRIISGKKPITLDQLDAICDALDLEMVQLISRAEVAAKGVGFRSDDDESNVTHAEFGVPREVLERAAASKRGADTGEDGHEYDA